MNKIKIDKSHIKPRKNNKLPITIMVVLSIAIIIVFFQIIGTLSELDYLNNDIESVKNDRNLLVNDLDNAKQQLDEINQNIQYLQNRSKYELRDPSYNECHEFILDDETNENSYSATTYNCAHYSRDVNNNAEEQGIRCAFVEVIMSGDYQHALIAFNTTDQGIVFFEPQTDEPVSLIEGSDYWVECVITDTPRYDLNPDNIVESYILYW
jgi:hypothetical protein